jgi:acyl-CoA thioesterase I
MVALYLACFSWMYWTSGRGWMPLVACVAILLVKRPDWSFGLTALAVTMTAVAAFAWGRPRADRPSSTRTFWIPTALLWTLWALTYWETHKSTQAGRPLVFAPNKAVVCIGDSLTAGAADSSAYPAYLQKLISVPVIDLGRPGISVGDALKNLSAIRDARPQVVVIELGGNDFVRGYSRALTIENLHTLIDACQHIGAQVVLMEIPRGFIIDPYSGIERELARNLDLELIPDTAIRMLVLRSPSSPLGNSFATPYLSDDGLHPNPTGALYLAEKVYLALLRMYGPRIGASNE